MLSTQSMQFRSVSEPSGENNLRGSREGFVELLRVNISLVRRLVRTETFMAETLTCGEKTQTELALLDGRKLVSQPLLDEIRRRASQARLPFLFDTGYLAPFLPVSYTHLDVYKRQGGVHSKDVHAVFPEERRAVFVQYITHPPGRDDCQTQTVCDVVDGG